MIDSTVFRLRPLVIHAEDWDMMMAFRLPLVVEPCFFMPNNASWNDDVFLIHLFLTRFGVKERSYLPVASNGRQYTYLDSKIASCLLSGSKELCRLNNKRKSMVKFANDPQAQEAKRRKLDEKRTKEDARRLSVKNVNTKELIRREKFDKKESDELIEMNNAIENNEIPKTPTLGEFIGMTPEAFNERRKNLVKELRKRNKEKVICLCQFYHFYYF